jgi:AraC-like DNA-binding protein
VAETAAAEAWRLAVRITGDDDLGLHMAQTLPGGALDLLEYAFRSSSTFESALDQLARYGRATIDRLSTHVAVEGPALFFTWGGPTERHRVEFALALVVRLGRQTTGTSLSPLDVRFSHPAPASLFEHRAFFRAVPRFDEPANQLVFARSDTARPLRSADPALAGVVRRRLAKMLAQLPRPDETAAAQVRSVLLDSLAGRPPTADAVARQVGLSGRTFHRRLRAEGTSFGHILDTVRTEIATALLREPGIGIAEIAFLLGYSEQAAFHRSFRRWTGQTPLGFRRASRLA